MRPDEALRLYAQLAQAVRQTRMSFTLDDLDQRFQSLLQQLEDSGVCRQGEHFQPIITAGELQGDGLVRLGGAGAYGEQCLELYRRAGDPCHLAQAYLLIGYAAPARGNPGGGAIRFHRALAIFGELMQSGGIVTALAAFAAHAEARGETERAVRLYAAADLPPQSLRLWLLRGTALGPASRVIYDREMAAAHQRYGGAEHSTAWAEGRAMTLDQAVAYALAEGGEADAPPVR